MQLLRTLEPTNLHNYISFVLQHKNKRDDLLIVVLKMRMQSYLLNDSADGICIGGSSAARLCELQVNGK